MKNSAKIIVLSLSTLLSINLNAQSEKNGIGIGFHVNQIQNDFGIGIDIISPYFANSIVAIKIGGSLKWLQHSTLTSTTWTPYQNAQLGIRSRNFIIDDKFFIYGEGGGILLIPNSIFSSEEFRGGGYGLFGFEFRTSSKIGFYFELGGVGTGARADKIVKSPIYSNGFLTNVGFRITL
jgi:hypothetical protein